MNELQRANYFTPIYEQEKYPSKNIVFTALKAS
jgi:hypothetical protein